MHWGTQRGMPPLPARLVVLNSPLRGREYPIPESGMTIGRGPENDLFIDQPSVSRQHARIVPSDDGHVIRDLGSRNGITVANARVTEARLSDGMLLSVGDVLFRYVVRAEPPASGAAVETVPSARLREAAPVRPAVAILSAALTIAALAALGGIYYLHTRAPSVRRAALSPVMVAVNERRIVPLRLGRAGDEGAWVDIQSGSIQTLPEGIVEAEKFEEHYLLITGRAVGAATVRMLSMNDNVLSVRVLVRGRVEDELASYRDAPLSPPERRMRADQHVAIAERLLAEQRLYPALRHYRIALALLDPVPTRGATYRRAGEQALEIEKRLQQSYRDEIQAALKAMAARDERSALAHLNQIMDLIPDENDPRHQRALFGIKNLLVEMERAKGRR